MSNFLITIIIVDILVFTVTYGIYTYLFLKQRKKQREIYSKLEIDIDILEHKKENLNQEIEERQEQLNAAIEELTIQREQKKQEFKEKCEQDYQDIKDNYDYSVAKINEQISAAENKLRKIQDTLNAATAAQTRAQEIKDNKSFYCLPLSIEDQNDIQVLERVKKQLNKPRILSMLIWSTYFQKPMNTLCNNILGTKEVTGIYKITNQLNNKCYIGQSVDISTRFKNHAKCGLGIDTPPGNKLYQAIQEDGIQNFSWELLEECSKDELNEKEMFYIELYQAKEFGYNTLKGVNSK